MSTLPRRLQPGEQRFHIILVVNRPGISFRCPLEGGRNTRGVFSLNNFKRIAAPNLPGLNHTAQNSATSAYRFLKSLPDGVHLVARFAFLGNFQKSFAGANPLSR